MVRVVFIVEGLVEENFVNQMLKPHFVNFGIDCIPNRIITSIKSGIKHRGGGVEYQRLKKQIMERMKSEPNAWVTTMFDLYKLPSNFPHYKESLKLENPYNRIAELERHFKEDIINDDFWRFIPYLQLYEFETLLFSDIDCFRVLGKLASLNNLKNELNSYSSNIELINGDEKTAPSKRIIKHFIDYQKTTDAPVIYNEIGLKTIRKKCQHFSEWIDKLEKLASSM